MIATAYDPTDPDQLRDPYGVFAELREQNGVFWSDVLSGWVAVDWESVNAVVTTPAVFSANRIVAVHGRLSDVDRANAADVLRWLSLWMVFQDPPNHTRLRKYLTNVINPRMAATMLRRSPRSQTRSSANCPPTHRSTSSGRSGSGFPATSSWTFSVCRVSDSRKSSSGRTR